MSPRIDYGRLFWNDNLASLKIIESSELNTQGFKRNQIWWGSQWSRLKNEYKIDIFLW